MRERRMSKYIVSIVLALAMVIGIAVFTLPTTTSAVSPSSSLAGAGTSDNPYKIGSVADWLYFANLVNGTTQPAGSTTNLGYFQLTADITFNEGDASTWGSSAPAINLANYGGVDYTIGNVPGALKAGCNPFVGTLDGAGHTISGVYINKTGGSCGLFASTAAGSTATIKNLIITNSYYQSDSSGEAGALIGQVSGGTTYIENVFVTDSVTIKSGGTSDGGILGHCGGNDYGDPTVYISNSVNGATVNAGSNQYVGGLIGNGNGKQLYINNCLNYGSITGGSNYVAGIVGRDDKAGSEFNNCINIGSLSGTVRQIVFSNSGSKMPILTNCLGLTTSYGKNTTNNNCAQINKDGFLTKGFLATSQGKKLTSGNWTELAYETSIPNGTRTIKEICMPTALVNVIGRSNLDFDKLHTNLCVKADAFPAPSWVTSAWSSGTVTISTVAQWKEFANFMNGVYEEKCTDNMKNKTVLLGADLDFNGEDITDYIVCKTAASGFKGTFDGQGHTISGVNMYKSSSDGDTVGLFGFTNAGEYATFQNLIIKDSYFESEAGAVGALIAQTAGGSTTVSNVYVDADVEIVAADSYVGGLVGHVGGNGYDFIDGTPGFIADSCVNAATVTSTGSAVGGILGNGNGKSYTVSNCLNIGDITGSKSVGGMVGYGRAGSGVEVSIEYCVNVGVITSASGENVEKACAITSMGSTARDTLTSYGCYYLTGTATYGVFEGSGESADGGATVVVLSVLLGETLPEKLEESGAWTARGDGTVFEICIPTGVSAFAPKTTKYHQEDNTPEWLIAYAETTEFTITTVAQWKEFASFVNGSYTKSGDFEGKTVYLGDDLDFENQDMSEYMVGSWKIPFAGTFDGQGHTITRFYVEKTDADTAAIFGSTAGGKVAIIKNLIVTASYFEAKGNVGAIVGQTSGGSTQIYNVYVDADVEIVSTEKSAGGLVGHVGQNGFDFIADTPALIVDSCVNAANVTAEGKDNVGGILGNANNKSVNITNCLNMGDITGSKDVGGIIGYGSGNADVEIIIDACVNIGTISGSSNVAAITVLSDKGTREATNCYYLKGTATNGVVSGTNTDVQMVSFLELGGEELPENLDGENWIARGNESESYFEICIPAGVSAFAPAETSFRTSDNTPEWLAEYADTDEFTINSVEQWKEFADFVNGKLLKSGNFEGKTVVLGDDLDFKNEDITAYMVGNMAPNAFKGTFDGQGHTISGVYMKKVAADGDTVALFGFSAAGGEATFQNLLITDSYFESEKGAVASLLAQTAGGVTNINNIYVTDSVEIVSGDSYSGGIAAHNGANKFGDPEIHIDSCVNAATVTSDGSAAGGILGNGNGQVYTVSNCLNMGEITGAKNVGGIVGYGRAGAGVEINIEFCVNVGVITSDSSTNDEKACAISSMGTTARDTLTASGCYYLTGTATYGVFEGSGESEDGGATAVKISALRALTLPEGFEDSKDEEENCKWLVRSDGNVFDICIPSAVEPFAPEKTALWLQDNTPEWLKDYANTKVFTITSVDQWKEFADFVNGAYTTNGNFEGKTVNLGADLDFADQDMNDYVIGAWDNPFVGTFDGQGHTITRFHVEKTDADTAGIFGATAGGKTTIISNLKVTASYFEAKGSVGAIVGQTSGGSTEIYNVYVGADVQIVSTGNYAGGLVGHVGQNKFDFIEDTPALVVDSCVNAAKVTAEGKSAVGGILGNANTFSVSINNCLNMGKITGGSNVGGILGNGSAGKADVEITIDACVNVGTVNATDSNPAAIATLSTNGTRTAINCYYLLGSAKNGVISGTDNDVQAVSLIVLGAEELPENLDSSYWVARGEGNVLEICVPSAVATYVPAETSFHKNSDNTPEWLKDYENTNEFSIETVEQWKEIADFIKGEYVGVGNFDGKTIYLANDIDFTGKDMTEYMLGTMTIPFAGTFDGQGYTISGFSVTKSEGDTAGIFGSTAGGKTAIIKNFKVSDSHFEAAGAVGAVVGQTSGGSTKIYNVYVDAYVEIVSSGKNVGGLVGHVGGNGFEFIDAPALIVDSCVNAAEIDTEADNVGGILGNANQKNITITNCLNMGDINGGKDVGGIIGYGGGSNNVEITIDACVNVGTITNASGNVAAIANLSESGTRTAINCYYLIDSAANGVVSGKDNDVQAVSIVEIGDKILPENLDSSKWIARGNGNVFEICVPEGVEGFVPETTDFRTEDDTPEWLQDYATENEFIIETIEQWKELANFINGEYKRRGDFEGKTVKLGKDLIFNEGNAANWEGNAPENDMTGYMISKIASKNDGANPFAGTFDGQRYAISGFYVKKEGGDTAGIFGATAGGKTATITNLLITNSYFESENGAIGALIGQTSGGTTNISNIYVTDSVYIVSGANDKGSCYAGGIVGHNGGNDYGDPTLIIDSCVSAATITGYADINDKDNAYGNTIGGILGNANGNKATITNCLNLGNITGNRYVGGIVGNAKSTGSSKPVSIRNCINIGTVVGDYEDNENGKACAISWLGDADKLYSSATNCFYLANDNTAYGAYSQDSKGKSKDSGAATVAFRKIAGKSLYINLDSTKWTARGDIGAQFIYEICIPTGVAEFAPETTAFYETVDNNSEWLADYINTDNFVISDVNDWKEFADAVNVYYLDFEGKTVELEADLVFSGYTTDYMIGSMANPFAGTFDGKGHTISGFKVVVEGADTAGIFGSTAGGKLATIRDLVITDSHFEAKGAVGALIGQTSGGSTVIENVYVTATVEIVSTGDYVGGLVGHVGQNGYSFIDDEPALSINACVNAANIVLEGHIEDVGGILGNGNLKEVIITNCLNVGDITGYRYVGGIAGLLSDKATVSYCINAGDINSTTSKGNNYFADIATGNVSANREVTITNCYYIDIKKAFVSESDNGTVNLEDNTPYFEIPTITWDDWTNVDGGLPTPFEIADVLTVSANVDRSVMLTGASVRMDTPTGIRFTAQFSKGFVDGLDDTAKIGILIVPKAYLDEAGEFTVEALDEYRATLGKTTYIAIYNYKNVENCFAKSTDEYYVFNAVLANIKEDNYTRDFCARAFIELEDGTILYSDYNDTNNRRNVAEVAEVAYNDTKTLDTNEGVAGYEYFVKEIEVEVKVEEEVQKVTKYVYSPYTAENRAMLYNFFYKEPEEPAAE